MAADFDAGINSSAAWAAAELSLSDEEKEHVHNRIKSLRLASEATAPTSAPKSLETEDVEDNTLQDEDEEERGKAARALYDFAGKAEFRELTFFAGDSLDVLQEDVETEGDGSGWSFARCEGEVGLVPKAYYIFTVDNASSSGIDGLPVDSRSDLTPRASLASSSSSRPAQTASQLLAQLKSSPSFSSPVSPSGPGNSQPLIVPQNTGEWFRQQLQLPSIRRSLLGGKSLNRFSSFVTSGAEDYVLHGPSEDLESDDVDSEGHLRVISTGSDGGEEEKAEMSLDINGKLKESQKHYIDYGPRWRSKVPPFTVQVHSPEKRFPPTPSGSGISSAYTVYCITSTFERASTTADDDISHRDPAGPSTNDSTNDSDGCTEEPHDRHEMTVHRRFSHFVFLHAALARLLPGIALPPLPEKQYAGRFSDAFVEARRADLQRYLSKIVRHPLARYAEVVMFFLGCDNEFEWKRRLPQFLAQPALGPLFYTRVFHPAFQFDLDDAREAGERFANHSKAVDSGVQQLRGFFGRVRSARLEMSNAERLLSYSLLSLITSKPIANASEVDDDDDEEVEEAAVKKKSKKGLQNAEGAWCWREECPDCLRLTKRMEKTVGSLQAVADLYANHARRSMLDRHDSFKEVAHQSVAFSPIVDTHKATLSRYQDALSGSSPKDEAVIGRCETVLNTTMAEFDISHTQKKEDFERITKDYLDGEIQFYEKILSRLRTARQVFDIPDTEIDLTMPGPRRPSIYEHELAQPRLKDTSLPYPPPHVYDSAPMRPVSAAIQGGMGLLFGGAGMGNPGFRGDNKVTNGDSGTSPPGRASVFSKFW